MIREAAQKDYAGMSRELGHHPLGCSAEARMG